MLNLAETSKPLIKVAAPKNMLMTVMITMMTKLMMVMIISTKPLPLLFHYEAFRGSRSEALHQTQKPKP